MTTTTTHTTPTLIQDTPVAGHRWGRWALAAGAVVAVATTGVAVNSNRNDPAPLPRPAAAVTDQQRAVILAEVAEMARENGLTGLSPLSLRPIERSSPGETVAEHGSARAAEQRVGPSVDAGRRSVGETVAEYGSITAIENG